MLILYTSLNPRHFRSQDNFPENRSSKRFTFPASINFDMQDNGALDLVSISERVVKSSDKEVREGVFSSSKLCSLYDKVLEVRSVVVLPASCGFPVAAHAEFLTFTISGQFRVPHACQQAQDAARLHRPRKRTRFIPVQGFLTAKSLSNKCLSVRISPLLSTNCSERQAHRTPHARSGGLFIHNDTPKVIRGFVNHLWAKKQILNLLRAKKQILNLLRPGQLGSQHALKLCDHLVVGNASSSLIPARKVTKNTRPGPQKLVRTG
jgi:hypothetical protein